MEWYLIKSIGSIKEVAVTPEIAPHAKRMAQELQLPSLT